MGGLNPAYPFVKACLMAGKHVVTSNKALVAAHAQNFLPLREKEGKFLFLRPAWEAESLLSVLCIIV